MSGVAELCGMRINAGQSVYVRETPGNDDLIVLAAGKETYSLTVDESRHLMLCLRRLVEKKARLAKRKA